MATFPATKRYFLRFRHTDTGLTPVFTYFNNASSFSPISPPTINEVNGSGLGNGSYYFDYVYTTKSDPDVVFEVDGGASIPTEEVRYISDTISPKDVFLDEPISQVVTDVWSDNTVYSSGQKGFYVPEIGAFGDASSVHSLFGQLVFNKESIRGDTAGFNDGNSVKDVYSRIGAPVGASISADLQADTTSVLNAISAAITSIQGAGGPTLAQMAGTGFVSATDSLVAIIAQGTSDTSTITSAITAAVTSIQGAGGPTLAQLGGTGFSSASDSLVAIIAAISSAVSTLAGDISTSTSTITGGGPNLNQIAGSGFATLANSLVAITADITAITPSDIANSVWDALLTAHVVAGSFGDLLGNIVAPQLARALGMLHENAVLDLTTFDANNNLLSGRLRGYNSKANADAAEAASPGVYDTGKISQYSITATYVGTNLNTYEVAREFP